MKKYHTLLIRDEDGRWCAEFGDYDKQMVKMEAEEYSEKTKIITTDHEQSSIDAKINSLNMDVKTPDRNHAEPESVIIRGLIDLI